jgi:hypothetical protein
MGTPQNIADGYIAPGDLTVRRDESNNLRARIDGRGEWSKVALRAAFPYSEPARFVALLHEGEELGVVRDPAELDEASRKVLTEELAKRYNVRDVVRILDITESHNATAWTVETDAGLRQMLVRDRHNFRRIKGGDLIVIDVDGNRFRIARSRPLDAASQRLLDTYC